MKVMMPLRQSLGYPGIWSQDPQTGSASPVMPGAEEIPKAQLLPKHIHRLQCEAHISPDEGMEFKIVQEFQ